MIYKSHWDTFTNEVVTLRAYLNNSIGNCSYDQVIIEKNIVPLSVTIITPQFFEIFGINPRNCSVVFNDTNGIDAKWYTIINATNLSDHTDNLTWTGTIDALNWSLMDNGSIILAFYANDTAGNIDSANVTIWKDIIAPIFNITIPHNNTISDSLAPIFNISMIESNLNLTWYQIYIDSSWSDSYFFIGNVSINQTLWISLLNGNYTIRFWANDTVGNIAYRDVYVIKYVTSDNGGDENDTKIGQNAVRLSRELLKNNFEE